MGVLEARADAEKVWYSIIWEETKENSNVIDYNIQEEITKDKSTISNANNDTTTGMATIIPWVNAHKLKLSTSIYVDKLDIPTVNQILYWRGENIHRPNETSTRISSAFVTQASYWTEEITYYASPQWILYSWLKIPVAWYYQLYARYDYSSSSFGWTYQWRTPKWWWSKDVIRHTYSTQRNSNYEYETITRYFEKGELFFIWVTMDRSSSTQITTSPDILIEVKKL